MNKKYLILTLCILIFACLFATSAFAVDYSEAVTLADGTTLPIYDQDHNPLIWYVSGTDDAGNNIYKSVPNNRCEPNENNDTYVTYTINTSWMTQLQEVDFHVYNGSEYEVINDDIYSVVVLNLRGLTSFQYINKGLRITTVQYVYFNEILKDVCDYFRGSTSLRLVDLSVCTDLTGGFGGQRNFENCVNLHTLRLAPGQAYSLAHSMNQRFKNTAITEIVIPANVTSLGIDNFCDSKNLQSIYILGSETSLGQRNFKGCTSLTNTYFLGDNLGDDFITAFKENFYECVTDRAELVDFRSTGKYFFFVTTNTEFLNSVKDAIEATAVISYADYVASPESYTEGRYIISDTSICDVYYGSHMLDENNSNSCAGICTVCGKAVMSNNPVHNYVTTLEYSSFLENGAMTQACQNSGCVHNITPIVTNTAPLFACLGYSAPENGTGGIVIGFSVNNVAILEYKEATGKTLEYGVFAVAQEKLGDKDVFDENGKAAEGVIYAEISIYDFAIFELKIVGFTDEYKDEMLAMGAYVAETDSVATEYSYMQDDTKGEKSGKYYFVSYNDIVGKPSAE